MQEDQIQEKPTSEPISRRRFAASSAAAAVGLTTIPGTVLANRKDDPTNFDPDDRKGVIKFIKAHDSSDHPEELEDDLTKSQEEGVIDVLLNPEWDYQTEVIGVSEVEPNSEWSEQPESHTARATIAGNVRYRFEQTLIWEYNGDTWRNASTDQDGNGDSFTDYDGEVSSQIRNQTDERFDARERGEFSLNVGTTWRTVTATITHRCEANGNAELINEDTPL
ncbi:hypothetical protein [Natronobacterium texcoconense]|uniref:Uncharacterized protein n=1 Tax=Natronobacterium texcoconense TaxID=1095778 RepID=A0A1H1EU81_NATTX|nr:hypothetical protein [Natronobacterium texcoconense]SDQ92094.1 hypothetical protein SAMN04489842_1696 [Natronobacterium texcoconense]